MRNLWISSLFVCLGLGLGVGLGRAQESATSPSLGDLAKQLRAQRAKAAQKPKLYTNDNLPARPPEENLTVAAGMSEPSGEQKSPKAGEKESAKAGGKEQNGSTSEGGHDEAYYRKRMSQLQDQLQLHQRELDVLQQKLSQNQTQFYSDPNKTLQQEYSRSDVNKLAQQIDQKKQQVADDQKAMDDLRDQLRREGGDSGWLR